MDSKHIQLCPIIDQSRNETYADIAEYFEHMIDYSEDHGIECPQIPRCKRSLYQIQVRSMDKGNPSQSRVKIQLDNPYVQTIEDSIAYDLQSLIGEVGGTLGLFLGLSTYSFVEFLVLLINKMFKEQLSPSIIYFDFVHFITLQNVSLDAYKTLIQFSRCHRFETHGGVV